MKGRQQGASTYTEARLYWKVTHNKGKRAFILTHEEEASKNLFEMASRYHEHCQPLLKPSTGASNGKELVFDVLDSGYKVGTAGNKAVGRSSTIQYFHGSEVGFWPHAEEHAKGIMQAIPDAPDTEVILESTANGIGNYYHQQWQMAERGESEYIAIFVPWYWQSEYRKLADKSFSLTDEELLLANAYNLDEEQLAWRRSKIVELSIGGADGGDAFRQEYPMTAAEAFRVSGGDGLITATSVIRARAAKVSPSGPLVVGVDPSRGGDKFAIIRRRSRRAYRYEYYVGSQVDKLGKQVGILKKILDEERPSIMFVDAGGGAEIVDRLHELGYQRQVKAISFAATPLRPDRFRNKRAEMWATMAEWLQDENLEVQVPDDDTLQSELCASPYERDSHDRIILLKKDKIKKKYGFSPDAGDALALTFAEPVVRNNVPIGETYRTASSVGY
jgi:hypothetical protein